MRGTQQAARAVGLLGAGDHANQDKRQAEEMVSGGQPRAPGESGRVGHRDGTPMWPEPDSQGQQEDRWTQLDGRAWQNDAAVGLIPSSLGTRG